MGLELVLLLVDEPALNGLLDRTWGDLYTGMEKGAFRSIRPKADARLKRSFDIDAEAELLDWMDSCSVDAKARLVDAFSSMRDGEEGLLHLMKYASPGAWEVWEGRAFLYLVVALKTNVPHVDDLYSESTWQQACTQLSGLSEDEFADAVCLDWMGRRKELGETLDEKEDPKIVPTYEAHNRASRTMVYAVNRWLNEDDLVGVVGREHLRAAEWGYGPWNLRVFLQG